MNPDWRAFLIAQGARITADDQVAPPPPAPGQGTAADCARFDLSHLGLIAVRGEDAETFLQGQVTTDVRTVTDSHSQLAGLCSPKGRMLALFRVMRLADGFYLQLPRERVAETLKRLRLFVMRAKVTLDDASDGPIRIGCSGSGAVDALGRLGLALPALDNDLVATDGVTLLRLPAPVPRFELIGASERLTTLWDALKSDGAMGDADGWALLDIRAGIPNVYPTTADTFVPQMVNLQHLDGVSFNKGCYVGQEVVARMQYLGTLKRRMYLAEVETQTAPQPGDELHSPASTSEQAAGRIVDARPTGPDRYELLAVVEIGAAEHGEVRLGAAGPLLRCEPPPYGFPAAASSP
ncbi:MAG TPA: folate-binding protein [Lamprocystis sp. (in: g-proteobacteria)]|nr:folate-binding protein [Lamprocystis sp. (in: g-proteobacteria)]